MVRQSRMRQVGWAALLAVCFALFVALSFRVNAVKSEVVRAEREIVSLEREVRRLETEFQTRANQHQLATWNRVEFGYSSPRADQFIETERHLAQLGEGRAPGSPAPIRVARAPDPEGDAGSDMSFVAMVSPLTGMPMGQDDDAERRKEMGARHRERGNQPSLADRLGAPIELPSASLEAPE